MDSKAIDRQLRDQFWPALKEAGFTRRTGRTAWRDRDSAVQCVNVQSFNAHIAQRLEATTYSFKLNTGVFFEAIASRSAQGRSVRDHSRPRESQCHVRRFLMKGIDQDEVRAGTDPDALRSRPDVWLLMPDSVNSGDVVADATERVLVDGLPWLERLSDPREAIRCFEEEPNVYPRLGLLAEYYGGAPGSPARWRSIAALAAGLRDWPLLERALTEMQKLAYWKDHPADLDALRAEGLR